MNAFELTPKADEKQYIENYNYLTGKKLLRSSDAHYLENMSEREFHLDLEENSASALIRYLNKEGI